MNIINNIGKKGINMNYYLDAKLQLFINKLKELKNKGTKSFTISVDTAINMLTDIQRMNKGEAPEKFDLDNYLNNHEHKE
jgi:hypothetical protein